MVADTAKQHATYHLAPNFSIGPPPDGMIHLGSIIDDLKNPDVLNEDALVEIPSHKPHRDVKEGFVASLSSMRRGDCGIWAKAVGLEGIGGEISASHERSSEVTYRFDSIETIYFYADTQYITQAMNQQDVKEFIKGTGYEPVYIVTGLKIARGPAVSVTRSNQSEVSAEVSISQPEVLPIDLGTRAGLARGASSTTEFEKSSDFIIGIRVKKLQYKTRGWGSRDRKLEISKHDKGATLVGTDDAPTDAHNGELEVEEVVLGQEMTGMEEILESDEISDSSEERAETNWIVSGDRLSGMKC